MNFYKPEDIRAQYDRITPVYQSAFAGPPWNERSKCPDTYTYKRCVGGLSQLSVGQLCDICELRPMQVAYEPVDLKNRFDELASTRPTAWYAEETDDKLSLAAIAWRAKPTQIAAEKYAAVPVMKDWLREKLGDEPVIWLDEVFANKDIKPRGNLRNFVTMCKGFSQILDGQVIAYRTISPQMLKAADRFEYSEISNKEVDIPLGATIDRFKFVYRMTLEDCERFKLSEQSLKAFQPLKDQLAKAMGVASPAYPIFINDKYTPYNYGGLLNKLDV